MLSSGFLQVDWVVVGWFDGLGWFVVVGLLFGEEGSRGLKEEGDLVDEA